jgi:N-acetylneuraminic acid mutarotase
VDSEPAVQGETENEKLVVAVELNGEDKVDDEMPVVEAPPASNGLSKLNGVFNTTEVEEVAEGVRANRVYNEWVLPTVTGRSPSARYQHAAEVVNNKLYVIGGNHSGRYLNDVQFLDLKTFEWSKVEKVPQSPLSEQQKQLSSWFPPCAGHSLIRWGTKLLAVAGRSKEPIDTVTVRAFDTHTMTWTILDVHGKTPIARGGQSVTLVGSTLVMFGGEDSKRRLMNDLNILDLETLTWKAVDTRCTLSHGNCIVIVFAHSHVLTYQLHIILAG